MNRKLTTAIFITLYLALGLWIMGSVNGFSHAKWFDGGMDLIYGVIVIYLSMALYYSSKILKNKNVFYVALGFVIILGDRIIQIFLQERDLKTGYLLAFLPWEWAISDFLMIIGVILICVGLWGVRND